MEITKLPTLPVLPKKRKVAAYARVSSGNSQGRGPAPSWRG